MWPSDGLATVWLQCLMLTSLVELEECCGEMLGHICVLGGVVVTVFGVGESVVELEECACGVVGNA